MLRSKMLESMKSFKQTKQEQANKAKAKDVMN